jgi:hypothetical protein
MGSDVSEESEMETSTRGTERDIEDTNEEIKRHVILKDGSDGILDRMDQLSTIFKKRGNAPIELEEVPRKNTECEVPENEMVSIDLGDPMILVLT